MQAILRWSIENSSSGDGSAPPSSFNPTSNSEIIDIILGKSDGDQMKEDVAIATDRGKFGSERISALEHLEMLVGEIDNANNLGVLALWDPLISLLQSSDSSPEIKICVLSVIGTAIQNNPAAQKEYLALKPLPTLLSFLTPPPSSTLAVREKAIYALSGLLKHNLPAVKEFGKQELDGWTKLHEALQDPGISVRRKTVFLLKNLILPETPSVSSTRSSSVSVVISESQGAASAVGRPVTRTSNTSAAPDIHTADEPYRNNPNPIHPNSHSAHLEDPSIYDTSSESLEAFERHDVVEGVVHAITNPLPYGEDGENEEPDAEFEEKAVQLLYTYNELCGRRFTAKEEEALCQWGVANRGRIAQLAESCDLPANKLEALFGK